MVAVAIRRRFFRDAVYPTDVTRGADVERGPIAVDTKYEYRSCSLSAGYNTILAFDRALYNVIIIIIIVIIIIINSLLTSVFPV